MYVCMYVLCAIEAKNSRRVTVTGKIVQLLNLLGKFPRPGEMPKINAKHLTAVFQRLWKKHLTSSSVDCSRFTSTNSLMSF